MKQSFIVLSGILAALPVYAQSLPAYLTDTSDAAVRIEVTGVTAPAAPQTLWQTLEALLGIRKMAVYRPDVGTKLTVQSSAYASSPYQTDATPCVTSAGTRVRPGVAASNFLPIGTVLQVDNLKFIVEDRMNPRYNGNFLDVWFPSTSEAIEFGRKKLQVTVVGYENPGTQVREIAMAQSPAPAKLTFWETVLGFIGARVSPNVNRYDVNCLTEEG